MTDIDDVQGVGQAVHVLDTTQAALQHKLADAAGGQHFIAQAPILFVICAIADQSAARYGERGRTLYVLQDTAAAVENLMVTAAGLGYGTCWIGAFDESAVSGAMDLPAEYRPVAMVPVGKAAKMPRQLGRKEISDILTIIK
ncbi:MAG: nitroreductase family protein [Calditrichia bacterium]